MERYTIEQCVKIVKSYYKNIESVRDIYNIIKKSNNKSGNK